MTATISERIIATLRVSGHAWDDDQLAQRLGVAQRQTVNQICRRLASDGRIHRYVGEGGKLVNSLVEGPRIVPAAEAPAHPASPLAFAAGHSSEQRAAERLIIAFASSTLGVELHPRRISTPTGARVEVDGADEELTVLVEAWAHQGPPKTAQKHKVLTDALKLTWIASTLQPSPRRLVLCFADEAAARPFRDGSSWATAALRDLRVEVLVAELPLEVRAGLLEAQRRQYR
ncbi:hypothetical protein [Amycolatopsis magusensis]|uniref:hypothetical protein n=1 Tax=Amycolatopsis magusensis TaxID=882444 RepID=UPI0024A8FCF5|nr:hypothetical protein [Amycolatopsis magusensis]MDI5977353.1 hypothetical protein [Amycolatopsis magusensis]